jgi:glutamate-1-semialdehyde aminotransferase
MHGVGGTVADQPMSVMATGTTLGHVLTDDTFAQVMDTATYFVTGLQTATDQYALPWSISQPVHASNTVSPVPSRAIAPSLPPAPDAQ